MATTNLSTSLSDVLYAFSLAKAVPDAELLDEFIRLYPEHAAALTRYAIDLALDSAKGDDDDVIADAQPTISPSISRVMSRFQNDLFAIKQERKTDVPGASNSPQIVVNPFVGLDRVAIRALTTSIHANSAFFMKLRDREIEPNHITDGLKSRLAEELHVPVEILAKHFSARPEMPGQQFYKADQKPQQSKQESFEEAIRSSGLTEEQQEYLMQL